MFVIAGIGLLSGCAAQMSKSIGQRVEVSEQCRQVQEDPLPNAAPSNILTAHLGNFGACDVWLNQNKKHYEFLPLCAFAQIQTKYDYEYSTDEAKELRKPVLEQFNDVVTKLNELRDLVEQKKDALEDSLKQPERMRLVAVAKAVNQIEPPAIRQKLAELRNSINVLRQMLHKDRQLLNQQMAIELAAWDTNFRATLDQFDRLLSGDYRLIVSDTLRNQVIVHVARRSLDMLHSALRPADAIINKLDQQGYGVISVSYMAFGPDIQDSVNKAKLKIEGIYQERLKKTASENPVYLQQFMREMRRAACSNLQQGTQFSMLAEIVDTLFITDIKDDDSNKTIIEDKLVEYDATGPAYGAHEFSSSFSASYAVMMNAQQLPAAPPVALHVSLANEWAARQMLLVEKMETRVKASTRAPEKDKDGKIPPPEIIFPTLEQVDEAAVTRIADAASAKVIDDAARSAPALLVSQTGVANNDLQVAISNNINVSAAAYAVSQASAMLNANFNINNSNTFNPTNTVAPVINVAPYPAGGGSGGGIASTPDAGASFCASGYFAARNAACVRDGRDYVVTFAPSKSFASNACSSQTIDTELKLLAAAAAHHAESTGGRFNASITGLASPPAATVSNCGASVVPRCTYVNQIRDAVKIDGCPAAGTKDGGNRMLSAARAAAAAKTLENAAPGLILVNALSAQGADSAYGVANENLDIDRTVVVRLQTVR
jgi:hypothetical protein